MTSSYGSRPNAWWRKATASTGNGACVEVLVEADLTKVRDSQDPAGPVVSIDQTTWRRFLAEIKTGYSGYR